MPSSVLLGNKHDPGSAESKSQFNEQLCRNLVQLSGLYFMFSRCRYVDGPLPAIWTGFGIELMERIIMNNKSRRRRGIRNSFLPSAKMFSGE